MATLNDPTTHYTLPTSRQKKVPTPETDVVPREDRDKLVP